MESGEIFNELVKVVGGGTGGVFVGYWAQKQAAKANAVKDLQLLKTEYKEFAEFTKSELILSREEREECQKENTAMLDKINELKIHVNELTMAIHNSIGTPTDIQKGLIK